MPVGRKYDIILNNHGYMLSRATKAGGRAWQRTGQPDTPDKRPRAAETVGALPPQIDYPELWNDWSGGFGYAYREPKDTQSYFGFFENPNRYHWSENFDARFPHQLIHCQQMQVLADGGTHRYASLNTNVNVLFDMPLFDPINQPAGAGGILVSAAGANSVVAVLYPTGLNTAGSQFDLSSLANFDHNGPGHPAIFGSFVYLPQDENSDVIVRNQLNAAITTTAAGLPYRGYATAGNRLWGYQGLHGLRHTYVQSVAAGVDPFTAANWSATLSIGNGWTNINDIRGFREQVFLGLEDGLYAGDQSGTFTNVLTDLVGHADADNCRDIAIHNGQVVVQHVAGIYAYDPSITSIGRSREIGPNLSANRSPIIGKVRALEAVGQWLYAGLWTGSQSYLMAGRQENPTDPYIWHPLNRYPHVARPQRIHVDGVTTSSGGLRTISQRMWAATDPTIPSSGTAPLYFWPIPMLNGDPLAPQIGFTANYVGSARIDLGIVDGRAPGTPKLYRSVTIESENLGSPNVYANVYYTIDHGTRTLLGTAIDSPRSVLYFPSTPGNYATGYGIELSIESFTTLPAVTPVYRSIVMRSTFRPRSVDLITAVIDVADETRDRQGSPMRPGAAQLAELRALAVQQQAVTLVDLAGATNIVEVLAPIEEVEQYQAGIEYPLVAATVKMAVMTFS